MGVDDGSSSGTQEPLLDAANRLERTIDKQLEIVADIDDKAVHTSRLVGILLALVFTLITLIIREGPRSLGHMTVPVQVAFALGLAALLLALGFAVVTYLSSRCRIGLHETVALYLQEHVDAVTHEEHLRWVVGSYGTMIRENNRVLHTNARQFRNSLGSLLTGVLFLSAAGVLYFGGIAAPIGWLILSITGAMAVSINRILMKEKFMPHAPHSDDYA